MSGSLSTDLRDSYRQLIREVGESAPLDLARARVLSNGGRLRRAEVLLNVVVAYRAGQSRLWGSVLLELLAPAILDRVQRLKARPPVLDPEDVRQQLVMEVLLAAATMPLPENPCHLRRALMARANQGVRRKLARERCIQLIQRPFDSLLGNLR
jgi:hypothetical protein